MADLHERIAAKLDELEALASAAAANCPMPWGYLKPSMELVDLSLDPIADMDGDEPGELIAAVASPDVVLRAVAEDRGVLARHGRCAPGCGVHFVFPAVPWTPWLCCKCGTAFAYCPEVLSVARRNGIGTGEP